MKKRITIIFILAFIVLFIPLIANAANIIDSGECESGLKWTLDDTGLLEFTGTGDVTKGTWNTVKVTEAIIPDGVTAISRYAFEECWKMSKVSIPRSVQTIGEGAFFKCESLTGVTLPEGISEIADSTFSYCKSLKEIKIPQSVKVIGHSAFQDCEKLSGIKIPNSVTELGSIAFLGCDSLKSITIPGSIKKIAHNCFAVCGLQTVIIEEGVEILDEGAFWSNYINNVTIPKSVLHIVSNAFAQIDNLYCSSGSYAEQWAINGKCVVSIYEEKNGLNYKINVSKKTAMILNASNQNAKEISIPATINASGAEIKVVEIDKKAFKNMPKLKTVTIGSNIAKIGNEAFRDCPKLKNITIKTTKLKKNKIGSKAFKGINKKPTFKCPKNMLDDYAEWLLNAGAPSKSKFKKK